MENEKNTSKKLAFTFEDFTRDDAKKVRTIIDAWDDLQEQLVRKVIPLQERRMQLDAEAPRTRRAYSISEEVWKKFDEIIRGISYPKRRGSRDCTA
ncbi:hypothetical protein [Pantoea sp. 3_1284]|uniref:hypothetical protein n=1 Tax=Pantoea sp. 3_1284 TaxID=2259618 RepID=UPI000DE49E0D|nr:hypothetical protein [Pantoea sp. 3_1284]RBO11082.1 hypothetical protein DSL62_19280 [Pantoea sp. 3_1284]